MALAIARASRAATLIGVDGDAEMSPCSADTAPAEAHST